MSGLFEFTVNRDFRSHSGVILRILRVLHWDHHLIVVGVALFTYMSASSSVNVSASVSASISANVFASSVSSYRQKTSLRVHRMLIITILNFIYTTPFIHTYFTTKRHLNKDVRTFFKQEGGAQWGQIGGTDLIVSVFHVHMVQFYKSAINIFSLTHGAFFASLKPWRYLFVGPKYIGNHIIISLKTPDIVRSLFAHLFWICHYYLSMIWTVSLHHN